MWRNILDLLSIYPDKEYALVCYTSQPLTRGPLQWRTYITRPSPPPNLFGICDNGIKSLDDGSYERQKCHNSERTGNSIHSTSARAIHERNWTWNITQLQSALSVVHKSPSNNLVRFEPLKVYNTPYRPVPWVYASLNQSREGGNLAGSGASVLSSMFVPKSSSLIF